MYHINSYYNAIYNVIHHKVNNLKKTRYLTLKITVFLMLTITAISSYSQKYNKPPLLSASTYQPLLVNEYQDLKDFWVSEKLDGIRGHWTGKILLTKNGHKINAPKDFTEHWPTTPLDGELWLGRNNFNRISSLVRRNHPIKNSWLDVRFMIFDLPRHKGDFTSRIKSMKALVDSSLAGNLFMIEQTKGTTHKALQRQLDDIVAEGAEGLMLHHKTSLYFNGRSTKLIKVKKYYDAEALVLKHIQGSGRNTQKLGSILVRTIDGITFKIGTGFSDKQRMSPPPIGSIITFKYYGKTVNNIPRFASFMRIRKLPQLTTVQK